MPTALRLEFLHLKDISRQGLDPHSKLEPVAGFVGMEFAIRLGENTHSERSTSA